MKLSNKMYQCLALLKKHSRFIRLPGGFWTSENIEMKKGYSGDLYPDWYFNWNTLEALIKRGLVEVTDTRYSKRNKESFPVEVKLTGKPY